MRAVVSTLFGETADSLVFFPLALSGVVPAGEMASLIVSQVILKTLYEIIVLPVTVRVVRKVKQHDGTDVYDEGVNYSVWKIFNLQ